MSALMITKYFIASRDVTYYGQLVCLFVCLLAYFENHI